MLYLPCDLVKEVKKNPVGFCENCLYLTEGEEFLSHSIDPHRPQSSANRHRTQGNSDSPLQTDAGETPPPQLGRSTEGLFSIDTIFRFNNQCKTVSYLISKDNSPY